MAIAITCQCGASFRAKDDLAGKQVKCPKCQAAIAVPLGQASPSSAPLSIDELMRLASAPSAAPQSSAPTPSRPPPSGGPMAGSGAGGYAGARYASAESG